jgi:aldose 1-epimerase
MKIETKDVLNKWKSYTLTNKQGMKVSLLNFGGIITEIIVPNKDGVMENVVLGFKDYADYENNENFFGAITGRVAGRIQDASLTLNGTLYPLEKNEGNHHLHGGFGGLHQILWNAAPFQTDDEVGVKLSHLSQDGDGGYPGNVELTVTYILNNDNDFTIDYEATTDKTTALTLTNHSYFNLSGNLSETIDNHHITMASSEFVELDEELIPTGKKLDATGTTFDFRNGRKLVDGMNAETTQHKVADGGYDHYFIFDQNIEDKVIVKEEHSGRILKVKTNQPGIVMYTGNGLTDDLELLEGKSKQYLGVCLETQSSPASLHHEDFPSVILEPNEKYEKQTTFSFRI